MLQSQTLRPGLLVHLSTTVTGNAKYFREDIAEAHINADGSEVSEWKTKKEVQDAAEYEVAKTTRAKCGSIIRSVCAQSGNFGLLCRKDREDELEKAIGEALKLAADFNRTANCTSVNIFCVTGNVEADDVKAVRAIKAEVSDLMGIMERGIRNSDQKVIREAASRAKALTGVLTPDVAARIQIAVDTARAVAKKIVQTSDSEVQEIDNRAIRAIAEQRTAFLDLSAVAVEAPATAPVEVSRPALDLAQAS